MKTLEEPPLKSIFIMCTTNPEKIPSTILSRAQRFNFQRISQDGIIKRLQYIIDSEFGVGWRASEEAIEYIAKMAEGGMRDAITMLDKCLSYSEELTIENVVKVLGAVDYDEMLNLTNCIIEKDNKGIIEIIDTIDKSGLDLKQFIKLYSEFILDINIYTVTKDFSLIKVPEIWAKKFNYKIDDCNELLDCVMKLRNTIKYEHSPKSVIIATFMLFGRE